MRMKSRRSPHWAASRFPGEPATWAKRGHHMTAPNPPHTLPFFEMAMDHWEMSRGTGPFLANNPPPPPSHLTPSTFPRGGGGAPRLLETGGGGGGVSADRQSGVCMGDDGFISAHRYSVPLRATGDPRNQTQCTYARCFWTSQSTSGQKEAWSRGLFGRASHAE